MRAQDEIVSARLMVRAWNDAHPVVMSAEAYRALVEMVAAGLASRSKTAPSFTEMLSAKSRNRSRIQEIAHSEKTV